MIVFAASCVVAVIALRDHWPAARVGIIVSASIGLVTLAGLLAAFASSNYLRREQLAEQRESAFQRRVDREIESRVRSLEAATVVAGRLAATIDAYERIATARSSLGSSREDVRSDQCDDVHLDLARWCREWQVTRTEAMMQILYIPLGVRSFIEAVVTDIDEIACTPEAIDQANQSTLTAGLEQCRRGRGKLDYFRGLAAVNLDPQSGAVIDYFTNAGSGPRVQPETGRLVGPNYPDLRRQTEVDHIDQPANPTSSLRTCLSRRRSP
ncbi:hypothetical protein ACIA8C_26770 [Nocardia sp. NPDC051321]|uniref:hypothetical protein n=1 Tax=Nocardia sp. NPDC051321 TaxID=3364323 RepID=UPI0037B00438